MVALVLAGVTALSRDQDATVADTTYALHVQGHSWCGGAGWRDDFMNTFTKRRHEHKTTS